MSGPGRLHRTSADTNGRPDGTDTDDADRSPWDTIDHLRSRLDAGTGIRPEQDLLLRMPKLSEEVGEVAQAVIGTIGRNPRKGVTRSWQDVEAELFLEDPLRARSAAPAPQDVSGPALGLLPDDGPQPRLAGPPQSAAPSGPACLRTWTLLTVARTRSAAGLRAWAGGFAEGVRTPCGRRQPMRWRTVWRMTMLGRPPVI